MHDPSAVVSSVHPRVSSVPSTSQRIPIHRLGLPGGRFGAPGLCPLSRDSTGPDVQHARQAADARRYAGMMAPDSGDDPYITWPPHPDPEAEELLRQANRDEYVIWFHEGVYTLVSPDGTKDFQFLGRVVASSGVWRHMISELRDWLEQTSGR